MKSMTIKVIQQDDEGEEVSIEFENRGFRGNEIVDNLAMSVVAMCRGNRVPVSEFIERLVDAIRKENEDVSKLGEDIIYKASVAQSAEASDLRSE